MLFIIWTRVIPVLLFVQTACSPPCGQNSFKVYYIPLDAQFYVPPTPEDIEKYGEQLTISSCEILKLFEVISKGKHSDAKERDLSRLRIKIVDMGNGQELYITMEKNIIAGHRKYDINKGIVNNALRVIRQELKNEWTPIPRKPGPPPTG